MSSQLVDLNSDNHNDILVGSFSGVPQIIMGLKKGYSLPAPIKDKTGQTVLIGDFWNRQTNEWDKTDRANSQGHCTSVSARARLPHVHACPLHVHAPARATHAWGRAGASGRTGGQAG